MFTKLGLAPLLAIAGFAVMPVTAQTATQYWYRSGVKLQEGVVVPLVMFGGAVNVELSAATGVNCRVVGGGTIENPVGGGAGVGRTNSLAAYECKGAECERFVFEKTGVPGRVAFTFENNPGAATATARCGGSQTRFSST